MHSSRLAMLGTSLVLAGSALAVTVAVAPATPVTRPAAKRVRPGLPNLVMHRITQVSVAPWYTREGKVVAGRWGVRFTSIVDNTGPGPFVIKAHRAAVGQPCEPTDTWTNDCEAGDMTADQLVVGAHGTRRYPGVADVYFDENHWHWHLRAAERYQLRSASGRAIALDAKTGFCYGDRLTAHDPYPRHYPGLATGLSNCRYGSTDPANDGRRALALTEGISAGWSDDYRSYERGHPLEGQELELTGLPAGRYVLVNTVNPLGHFHETTRADNVSSVRLALTWPSGPQNRPRLRVIGTCVAKRSCR